MGYWGRLALGILDAAIAMGLLMIFFPDVPGWGIYSVGIIIANIEMARLEILDELRK